MLWLKKLFNSRQKVCEDNLSEFYNGILLFHMEESKKEKLLDVEDYVLFKRFGWIE